MRFQLKHQDDYSEVKLMCVNLLNFPCLLCFLLAVVVVTIKIIKIIILDKLVHILIDKVVYLLYLAIFLVAYNKDRSIFLHLDLPFKFHFHFSFSGLTSLKREIELCRI